jgi:hypothetical protein
MVAKEHRMKITTALLALACTFVLASTSRAQEAQAVVTQVGVAPVPALAAVASPVSPQFPAVSPGELPPGFRSETRPRWGLVIGGAAGFVVAYAINDFYAVIGTVANCGGDGTCGIGQVRVNYGPMYVPLAGPFIEMGQAGVTAGGKAFLAIDGLVQAGMLTMMTIGLALPKTVIVQSRVGSNLGVRMSLAPIVAPGRQGMGLVGTF